MRKRAQDILMGIAAQNARGLDCLLTSRHYRKVDALALVDSGHVVSRECVRTNREGQALQPYQWTTGYELTERGRTWLANAVLGPDGYAPRRVVARISGASTNSYPMTEATEAEHKAECLAQLEADKAEAIIDRMVDVIQAGVRCG